MPRHSGLTCIDLFAGCGGLSLGLEQAGFEPLLYSELNKDARETYKINRPQSRAIGFGDIADLLTKDAMAALPSMLDTDRIDLICGGPPCQGFSGIGHRRSYKVERKSIPSNHLYLDMISVIKRLMPRAFLFENVKGLLTGRWTEEGDKGEIWRDVLSAFREIEGYRVDFAVVQAKNYGVPQNRPRILLVGVHDDVRWTPDTTAGAVARGLLPRPIQEPAPDLIDVLGDLVDPAFPAVQQTDKYPHPASTRFQKEMRSANPSTARHRARLTEHVYSKHSPQVSAKFEYMIAHGGTIPASMQTKKFAQRLLPKRWGEEGPTITATSLPDDFVHFSQPRTPTVREWARIQCFPDWYQFAGKRTTGGTRRAGNPDEGNWEREVPKYTQIGNAVPVRLAHQVGLHLAKLLKQSKRR